MQFKREMADLIMAGKKTQTRRIAPPRHKVGSRQPIQCGYRCKALGYIVIDKVYRQMLDEMSTSEVEAEGFYDWSEYMSYLRKINKTAVHESTVVTVYEFHLEEKP